MNLICKITDADIGETSQTVENPRLRQASRGIVIKGDKVAVFNKTNKNEYKFQSGGMEENETPEEIIKREVLEETGCDV